MRKYIRLLLALTFVLAVTAPPPAQADYWKGEVYYYDACYTQVIGYFVRYCTNRTSSWGQTSAYSTQHPFDCELQ